jgi:hypothetical protein
MVLAVSYFRVWLRLACLFSVCQLSLIGLMSALLSSIRLPISTSYLANLRPIFLATVMRRRGSYSLYLADGAEIDSSVEIAGNVIVGKEC